MAITTVGVALATLSACGSGSSSSTAESAASAKNTKGGLISLITSNLDNPYWTAEADAVKEQGTKLGYKVNVVSHQQDPKKESDLIDTAITNKSVAIILDNAGADSSIGDVQKATDAGIPVFLVNAEINKTGLAEGQLVSNNAQGAVLGAQQFVKVMGGKGKYVELLGLSTDTNASVRSNGYKSVLSQYPEMQLLQQEAADWDQQKGFDKMQLMLQAHPDVQGVIAGNDQMALGAIAAIKQAGKAGKIVVGGFDGSPDAVQAVEQGELAYTVLQPVVEFSKLAVDMADKYLKTGKTGGSSEKQAFDCTLITKDNVGGYSNFSLKP
ncbi:substrate-binding domain-containing protein [Streptomyces sp. NPDC000880]